MKFRDMPKLPLVLIAAMFIIGAVVYPRLPARIPVHWGPTGAIDGWASKSFLSVFLAPVMLLGVYVVLWLAPYLDPKRGNLIRSKRVYVIVLELVAGLMTVIFIGTLFAAFNNSLPMSAIVEVCVGVMFIVLGNYMGRVKRNWTMGVRYSWTLSDDVVWAKTNRLGGKLFVAAGALAVVGAFLPPLVGVAFILLPGLVILPVTYVYSMRMYKERHPDEMDAPDPPDRFDETTPSDDAGPSDPPAASLPSAHPVRIDVTCPSCGADNAPDNTECIVCGDRLAHPGQER